jgi:PAS domain S-box-containing protein
MLREPHQVGHRPLEQTPRSAVLASISPDRLAEILDVAEDGIVTVDAHQCIVLFNRGAAKLFGYEPKEVLGQPLNLLIPSRFHATHPRDVETFAQGPVTARAMGLRRVVTGRRKDGSEFPAEVTISKILTNGELLLTAIVRDAVERKKYETAMLQLNQELEERVRQRTGELAERNLQLMQKTEENEMFVYSVSHDLRSPLVNLEGFSQELQLAVKDLSKLLADPRIPSDIQDQAAEVLNSGVLESVSFIRTAVDRLGRIIDALLRLSRAGRVEYRLQVVDVHSVARRVVDSLRNTAAVKKAEVVLGALPPAWADPDAVEQILGNLIANALNYLDPARPGRVEIGCLTSTAKPHTHTYFVRDNGVGIPAAYAAKLFQAFQRLHPDKASGEGIGLAIVRRVLERLGGTITVESKVGEGTTFSFTLPTDMTRPHLERHS